MGSFYLFIYYYCIIDLNNKCSKQKQTKGHWCTSILESIMMCDRVYVGPWWHVVKICYLIFSHHDNLEIR
jgi:hypothetical protein